MSALSAESRSADKISIKLTINLLTKMNPPKLTAIKSRILRASVIAAVGLGGSEVFAATVSFTKLTGVTGGSTAATAVYRADLTGILTGTLASITIADNSGGLGGATGQFSGFDLDAIKLSYTSVSSAGDAASLVGLAVFDFVGGTIFAPGGQRPPEDPKLYGTGPGGNTVDNSVATLGAFDANSSIASPSGFLSMGDNGTLSLNLMSSVDVAGLYLYIGEVGDNGEVAAGAITVSDRPVNPTVPEGGSTVGLLALTMWGLLRWGQRRHR